MWPRHIVAHLHKLVEFGILGGTQPLHAQLNERLALVELYEALGGGWQQ